MPTSCAYLILHRVKIYGQIASLIVFLMVGAFEAHAWSGTIHRAVCEVVWQGLSIKEKAWIESRTKNHRYAHFSTGCAWPDWVRKKVHYAHTHAWHYEDYREDADSLEPVHQNCPLGCLRWALQENAGIIRAGQAGEIANGLYFYAHLLTDLHQPLHVGRHDDAGGNYLELLYNGDKISLHQLWDSRLFATKKARLIGKIQQASKQLPNDITEGSTNDWLLESRTIAETEIYAHYTPKMQIAFGDVARWRMLGYQQMAKAAQRLLFVLQKFVRESPQ